MNVFVVYAHPEQSSYNAVLNKTAVETLENQGHTVVLFRLYEWDLNVASRHDFLKKAIVSNRLEKSRKLLMNKDYWLKISWMNNKNLNGVTF